ncbi:hypothetical protein N2152v2_002706 [Parachlorella kessleri]
MQTPAAVAGFLIGLRDVLGAFSRTAVDYDALNALAISVDSVVDAIPQLHDREGGSRTIAVQRLLQTFVSAAATCMAAPDAAERWALTPASPALVPILRLALAELSTACQLAAESFGRAAGRPTQRAGQQAGHIQMPEGQLAPGTKYRGECSFLLLYKLLPLTQAAADQGRCEVQRLSPHHAPGFIKFVELCGSPASQLTAPQLSMLQPGICGLTFVLKVQRRLLRNSRATSHSKTGQPASAAMLAQRMQWVAAAAAFAKVLHRASDDRGQWGSVRDKIILAAGEGLSSAMMLTGDMYSRASAGSALTGCLGGHEGCSKLQDVIQLVELLARLVPKRSALVADSFSGELADTHLNRTRAALLNCAACMADEALGAPVFALPAQQQARTAPQPTNDSHSSPSGPSGSSRGGIAYPGAETLVQSIASLAGTAVKLHRCLPNLAVLDPADARRGLQGSSYQYVSLLEKVAELCCDVLAANPHLVQAPGPQRSLTRHLQRTGFLTFVCLPALAEAHGAMNPYDRATLLERRETDSLVGGLIPQLGKLHLIDEAVRGGGLGPLLRQCLDNLLTPRFLGKAASLLLVLVQVVAAEQSEGLAVALVTSGLLQAAAQQSRRLVGGKIRRARDLETIKGILPSHTALRIRAVCSALDDHAGLLTAFSTLLGDVPSLSPDSRVGRDPLVPGGAWLARFATKQAWEQVCDQLLPALTAACESVASGSEAQQQNGIFRDVAVSAWTCCNPGCTNMAGQQETTLALSKQCQRQDWRRHKPICQAIKGLK